MRRALALPKSSEPAFPRSFSGLPVRSALAACIGIAALAWACACAADDPDPSGLSFQHQDWELACDNTRTCRAAGYQTYEDAFPISVLLTRLPGPGTPVTGRLALGDESPALPSGEVTLRIDGTVVGTVASHGNSPAELPSPLVDALLAALRRDSVIEWQVGEDWLRLSDDGAAAVLLKMDEFQGRLGTPGALIRKGTRSESDVLPAVPAPVIVAARVPVSTPETLTAEAAIALKSAIAQSLDPDECPDFDRENLPDVELTVWRLTETQRLASLTCWFGAYNFASGFWVMDDTLDARPVWVTDQGNEYEAGVIRGVFKGRGIGDCLTTEEWTWTGTEFVHTASSTTGMCRMVTLGGTWNLPTRVTNVKPAEP